ncbi:hypothetical protein QWZ16_12795 [Vibrio ostreicida]|uniref:Uncharacterized protein n=1 Tax=Vibrio ostreicida TaxID=526588 RepID=A0ABT8BWW2_9VIBR|nr:hypothetical protein [Vibrio ostreicida]MDN3610582.1 hypothetical protein [Vibrio ostreicida]
MRVKKRIIWRRYRYRLRAVYRKSKKTDTKGSVLKVKMSDTPPEKVTHGLKPNLSDLSGIQSCLLASEPRP